MPVQMRGYTSRGPGMPSVVVIRACRSCEADVVWARTEKNRSMILDAAPNDAGTFVLVSVTPAKCERFNEFDGAHQGLYRFVSHWATCPHAPSWKTNRNARGRRHP
jgi:hypothetical protein